MFRTAPFVFCLCLLAILLLAISASATPIFKVLHSFSGTDGSNPWDALLLDDAGNLYGTTHSGGDNDAGTVFKLAPGPGDSWTQTTLYSFLGSNDGLTPIAGLVMDRNGNLYGTTLRGGTRGAGVVFRLNLNPSGTWTETVLHSFIGSDGSNPVGGVTFASGSLFGTTSKGGRYSAGVIYKLSPKPDGTWTERIRHHFKGGKDGSYPDHSSLVFGRDGNIYGATAAGGGGDCNVFAPGCGTMFRLVHNPDGSWSENILHRFFKRTQGSAPESTPVFDSQGNLYGTTEYDGKYGNGTIFELSPTPEGTWKTTVLHHFHGLKDGANPDAGLIIDSAGNLYGTTASGGADANGGTVYKLTPGPAGEWTFSVLHRFRGSDGMSPYGGLIVDTAGHLYGTTQFGGGSDLGVVFQITP